MLEMAEMLYVKDERQVQTSSVAVILAGVPEITAFDWIEEFSTTNLILLSIILLIKQQQHRLISFSLPAHQSQDVALLLHPEPEVHAARSGPKCPDRRRIKRILIHSFSPFRLCPFWAAHAQLSVYSIPSNPIHPIYTIHPNGPSIAISVDAE
jgi:hypothetical protein